MRGEEGRGGEGGEGIEGDPPRWSTSPLASSKWWSRSRLNSDVRLVIDLSRANLQRMRPSRLYACTSDSPDTWTAHVCMMSKYIKRTSVADATINEFW